MTENTGATEDEAKTENAQRPDVRLVPVQLQSDGSYSIKLNDEQFHPAAKDILALCELVAKRAETAGMPLLPSIDQSDSANSEAMANAIPFPIVSDRYGSIEIPVDIADFLTSMDNHTAYEGELIPTDLIRTGHMMKKLSDETGMQWVPMPVGKAEDTAPGSTAANN